MIMIMIMIMIKAMARLQKSKFIITMNPAANKHSENSSSKLGEPTDGNEQPDIGRHNQGVLTPNKVMDSWFLLSFFPRAIKNV